MTLYVVHLEVDDGDGWSQDRIIGPYRSEEAARAVAELVRGRAYTRLVKRRGLIGSTGAHPDVTVMTTVRPLHNEAAKYHYDWAEALVLEIIKGRD